MKALTKTLSLITLALLTSLPAMAGSFGIITAAQLGSVTLTPNDPINCQVSTIELDVSWAEGGSNFATVWAFFGDAQHICQELRDASALGGGAFLDIEGNIFGNSQSKAELIANDVTVYQLSL